MLMSEQAKEERGREKSIQFLIHNEVVFIVLGLLL